MPYFGQKKKSLEVFNKSIEEDKSLSPLEKAHQIANAKTLMKEFDNRHEIVKIAVQNSEQSTDFSENSQVDDEWLARFMDSAKFVSNDEMRLIWGRMLAGEFKQPGNFPKQSIRILSELSPQLARVFSSIAQLCVILGLQQNANSQIIPIKNVIVPDSIIKGQKLPNLEINFATVTELESFGLIRYDGLQEFIKQLDKEQFPTIYMFYGNQKLKISDYPDKQFPIGSILLTQVGTSIADIIEQVNIDGYFDSIKNYMTSKNINFEEI